MIESHEPTEAVSFPEPFPRLWGVILFRLVIAGICIYLFSASLSLVNERTNSITVYEFAGVMRGVVITCVWSLVIAAGLFLQKRWAWWLVFLFDAVFFAFYMGYAGLGIFGTYAPQLQRLSLLAIGLFVWEGTYVATKLWGAKTAKSRYTWAVVVFLILGIAGNKLEYHRQISRVRPVLAYVDSNLWNLPVDYEKWKFRYEFTKFGEYESKYDRVCESGYRGYPEYQILSLQSYDDLGAKHRSRIKRGRLLVYLCPAGNATVKNQEDILKTLRKNGARIPDLRYVTTDEVSVKVLKDRSPLAFTSWLFISRSTGIVYLVSCFENSDSHYQIHDVNIEILEKEYERLKRNGWK